VLVSDRHICSHKLQSRDESSKPDLEAFEIVQDLSAFLIALTQKVEHVVHDAVKCAELDIHRIIVLHCVELFGLLQTEIHEFKCKLGSPLNVYFIRQSRFLIGAQDL
jgi:hypothetical protein